MQMELLGSLIFEDFEALGGIWVRERFPPLSFTKCRGPETSWWGSTCQSLILSEMVKGHHRHGSSGSHINPLCLHYFGSATCQVRRTHQTQVIWSSLRRVPASATWSRKGSSANKCNILIHIAVCAFTLMHLFWCCKSCLAQRAEECLSRCVMFELKIG